MINVPVNFNNDRGDVTFNMFSFFTIQSNIIVIICFLAVIFENDKNKNKWFLSYNFFLVATSYISITFLIYNALLLPTSPPTSPALWVETIIMHIICPFAMIFYFLFLLPKPEKVLSFNQLWRKVGWKFYIYPACYLTLNLVRGEFRLQANKPHPFPYFFLNFSSNGPLNWPGYVWLIFASIIITLLLLFFVSFYNLFYYKKLKYNNYFKNKK